MSGTNEQRSMIFHVPFGLNPESKTASGIRPYRLRQAFEQIGYRVHEVSGRHAQRRDQMRELRRLIRDGMKVDFVYSEAATSPTGLGEPVTPATSLTRDIRFLRFCRRSGIPVGLFYRDIYWQFPEYEKQLGPLLTRALRSRYRADLRGYRTAVDRIYLPSMRMAEYLPPQNRPQAAALPPGLTIQESQSPDSGVAMLFVGGLGSYYRLHEAVRGVEQAADARLVLCAPEAQWKSVEHEYRQHAGLSTEVVHASGDELETLYDRTNLGSLFMEPIEYRQFAAPMKMYEYLGHGKPIVATEGTLVGEFVEQHGVGWTIPYEAAALAELLDRLNTDREELRASVERVRSAREEHTWEARAREVARDLTHAG